MIRHGEKTFSVFEEHTRWIAKGKAGTPAELGVPVAIVEDDAQFLLDHAILWKGGDVDAAVPLVRACLEGYPDLRACSFDRGFHSPENRVRLDGLLVTAALPKKGKLNAAERAREAAPAFARARRRHPAVESAINNLEQRGLDRVRSKGADGWAVHPGGEPAPDRSAPATAGASAGRSSADAAPQGRLTRPNHSRHR